MLPGFLLSLRRSGADPRSRRKNTLNYFRYLGIRSRFKPVVKSTLVVVWEVSSSDVSPRAAVKDRELDISFLLLHDIQ